MNSQKTHQIDAGKITLIEDDILLIQYNPAYRITRKDLLETQEIRRKLMGDNRCYTIVDYVDGMPAYSGEAKSFAAVNKEVNEMRIMDVIITTSWKTKIDIMIYKKLFKPKKEMVIVDNMEKAFTCINMMKEEMAESVPMAG